jgi:phosphoribosyl-ATP pyrophosphohydrolase
MSDVLDRLIATIEANRHGDPQTSYVAKLTARGREKIVQKLGEEAVETVIAGMKGEHSEIVSESADLVFHLCMLLVDAGLTLDDVRAELVRREGVSGLEEKAKRASRSPE